MQVGIAAWLRHLAVRCNEIRRHSHDPKVKNALASISVELADKAEALEETFKVKTARHTPPPPYALE